MWAAMVGEQTLYAAPLAALEDEHRHIVELLDELHKQIVERAPVSEQRFALHVMAIYLRVNCLGEEALMRECLFPLRGDHEEEHRAHFTAVRSIDEQISSLKHDDALLAVDTLRREILNHIRERDQEVVDWKQGEQTVQLQHSA